MTYFTLSQWRRSVVKSEGPGRVSQVKPSNSKPIEIRFRFRRRNGLFAHFWLFFIFGRKWIFIFIVFFVFVPKAFALGRKCYVRNWTVTKFCDIGRWLSFSFSGRKWNFIFVGIFVYGRKWKMHFRSTSKSNCFRLHLQSIIFKHSTITVQDCL